MVFSGGFSSPASTFTRQSYLATYCSFLYRLFLEPVVESVIFATVSWSVSGKNWKVCPGFGFLELSSFKKGSYPEVGVRFKAPSVSLCSSSSVSESKVAVTPRSFLNCACVLTGSPVTVPWSTLGGVAFFCESCFPWLAGGSSATVSCVRMFASGLSSSESESRDVMTGFFWASCSYFRVLLTASNDF